MAAIIISLQFDHDEVRRAVNAQEIDAALRVLPLGELLSDHEDIVGDDRDVGPQKALKIAPLLHALLRERGGGKWLDRVLGELVHGHCADCTGP